MEMAGHIVLPTRFQNVANWSLADFLLKWIGIPFTTGPLYGPLWYVRDLFIISIIAPFFQKFLRKCPICFLLISLLLWFSPISHMFRQTVLLFIIGEVLSMKSESIVCLKKKDYRIGFLTLIAGVATSFIKIDYFYQLIILLYILSAFLICKEIDNRGYDTKRKCELIASHIFLIYVLHGKPLSVMQIVYTSVVANTTMIITGYFIFPLICFFLCLIISIIFKKIMPKIYKICTGE